MNNNVEITMTLVAINGDAAAVGAVADGIAHTFRIPFVEASRGVDRVVRDRTPWVFLRNRADHPGGLGVDLRDLTVLAEAGAVITVTVAAA